MNWDEFIQYAKDTKEQSNETILGSLAILGTLTACTDKSIIKLKDHQYSLASDLQLMTRMRFNEQPLTITMQSNMLSIEAVTNNPCFIRNVWYLYNSGLLPKSMLYKLHEDASGYNQYTGLEAGDTRKVFVEELIHPELRLLEMEGYTEQLLNDDNFEMIRPHPMLAEMKTESGKLYLYVIHSEKWADIYNVKNGQFIKIESSKRIPEIDNWAMAYKIIHEVAIEEPKWLILFSIDRGSPLFGEYDWQIWPM